MSKTASSPSPPDVYGLDPAPGRARCHRTCEARRGSGRRNRIRIRLRAVTPRLTAGVSRPVSDGACPPPGAFGLFVPGSRLASLESDSRDFRRNSIPNVARIASPRDRLAEQPALAFGAAEPAQAVPGSAVFNALGGDRQLKRVAKRQDGADDRVGLRIGQQRGDEALVDLDPVERQAVDLRKDA